jgi:4a-hydroxytetrahydrobiopterin dehydratase
MEGTKKCSEWEVLSAADLQRKATEQLPLWNLVQTSEGIPQLQRSFVCKDFQGGLNFIAAAGAIAERLNHHPDLSLTGYRNITITIFTHSLGGCTDLDIQLASTIDQEVKISYSPKYLKENPLAASTAL